MFQVQLHFISLCFFPLLSLAYPLPCILSPLSPLLFSLPCLICYHSTHEGKKKSTHTVSCLPLILFLSLIYLPLSFLLLFACLTCLSLCPSCLLSPLTWWHYRFLTLFIPHSAFYASDFTCARVCQPACIDAYDGNEYADMFCLIWQLSFTVLPHTQDARGQTLIKIQESGLWLRPFGLSKVADGSQLVETTNVYGVFCHLCFFVCFLFVTLSGLSAEQSLEFASLFASVCIWERARERVSHLKAFPTISQLNRVVWGCQSTLSPKKYYSVQLKRKGDFCSWPV